jgi:glycosyltransferase involved in cell wall biosynthesis
MRVLLLTETVPWPLDSGGRIKTWHTLRALAREHEVHCHTFVRTPAQQVGALGPLRRHCASAALHLLPRSWMREGRYAVRALVGGVPFTVSRHYEAHVMRALVQACHETRFDVVYCDHLSMAEYGRRLGLPIVVDAHNVEYRIVERHAATLAGADPRRVLLAWESRRLKEYEARAYGSARLVFAVSEVDAAEIEALTDGRQRVVTVPIAVDVGAVSPSDGIADGAQVLFVGPLDWPPNADAVNYCLEEIWPRVRARRPDASLVVVGRNEAALVRRWGGMPAVRFTGWVSDVEPWFRSSRVAIVPLRSGSGLRVKILDAFARRVPVVTTSIGVEGIAARPGVHALIEDDPEGLAAAVVRVIEDRSLAQSLAAAARQLVVDRYDLAVVGRLQLDALQRLGDACRASE